MPYCLPRYALPVVHLLVLLAVAACVARPPAAFAQSSQEEDSVQTRRFQLADSYLRAGQYERAIALLEDLYADAPDTHVFYTKLKEAYESVKRYEDAIALVEERFGEHPVPAQYSEKARLLYLDGDEDAAFRTWEQALSAAPDQASTYRVVYQALVNARRFERAIDVLERGRERLDAPDAFRTDLAYLYSLNGQHGAAIEEYLALLAENEQRLGFVRRRLNTFIEQDDALAASIAAADSIARAEPTNLAYRELLGWLYMEGERYREAFDVYRAIDRLQQENGRRLLAFAHQAADAQVYDVALDAYNEILDRYPDAPVAPEAWHSLGDMHRRWAASTGERAFDDAGRRTEAPHYEAAAEAYRTFLEEHPGRDAYPSVLQKLGRLQQDVFLKLDDAEATLQEVVRRYPDSEAADEARYDLGRIALMRGNLGKARLAFSRLAEQVRTGDLAERARYELALLHFYRGEFAAARERLRRINTNTDTDVANDAIELKVLLIQNQGPDSLNTPLRHYAEARLLQRQRHYDEALALLDTLRTAHAQHGLADEAHFLRATLLREQGRIEPAVETFVAIPERFPQSPLADRSLFEAARTQEQALDDTGAALDTYSRLLEAYPSSLLAAKARERIRALQRSTRS